MKVSKLDTEKAITPTRKHDTDAGIDLYSTMSANIEPHKSMIIPTGITVEIPGGCVGLIMPKSRSDFLIGGGVIDQGYQGEILVKVVNYTDQYLSIVSGQAVAQMIILPCFTPSVELVDIADIHQAVTDRAGTGGIVYQQASLTSLLELVDEN